MKDYKKIGSLITPLSSIFGSGFLIIVPILAASAGKYSVFAMTIICLLAYAVGHVIRYNIKNVEPLIDNDTASNKTKKLEHLSDYLLIPAYIVSVTLYLKIFAAFALSPFNVDTQLNENILVTLILVFILIIELTKGLKSLAFLEKVSLFVTFIVIFILFVAFCKYDTYVFHSQVIWPTPKDISLFERIKIIAGTLIVVQGFETTRYLSYKYDTDTRIKACRNSQIISTIVYITFVLLATPITYNLNLQGELGNSDLINLTRVAAPLAVFPLIIGAMLSQFSAAIADTFGASGNLEEVSKQKIKVKKGTTIIIVLSIILTWLVASSKVVALSSRAFAIYYFLQVLVAMSVSNSKREKALFIFLLFILFFIVVFATPAG